MVSEPSQKGFEPKGTNLQTLNCSTLPPNNLTLFEHFIRLVGGLKRRVSLLVSALFYSFAGLKYHKRNSLSSVPQTKTYNKVFHLKLGKGFRHLVIVLSVG